METRAHHVLIGFFTLAVGVAGLLFGLWLAKTGDERNVQYYDIVFREAVSGLTVGSAVEYSGIRVGDVAGLKLDPTDPRRVFVRVRLAGGTPVKIDTRARLALANITGAANIQLSEGSPDSPLLTGKAGQIPVIQADTSPFSRLRMNSEDVLVSLSALLDNAKLLLSKENVEHVSGVLANVDAVTGVLAAHRQSIGQGIADLARASHDLEQILAQLDGKGKNLVSNADQTLASLARFSSNLERLLAENRPALTSGMQSMAELGPTIRELRTTLMILGDISRRLEEDPAGYLLERQSMKEFRP